MTIGFLGAGQLGEPMVDRLLAAGKEVCVFARREHVRSHLRGRGASLASSIADLASRSDILIVCLFSDAQIHQTAWSSDGFLANLRDDAVVVLHTTGTVSTLDALVSGAANRVVVVDAPVSGTADDIAGGRLTVLLGGAEKELARLRPVLGCYADPIYSTGATGSALRVKLINNMLFAANAQLVAQAVEVGRQFEVAPEILMGALSMCSGGSVASAHVLRLGGMQEFATLAAPFLRKDAGAAAAAAQELGVDFGLLGAVVAAGPLPLGDDGLIR